jgi:hypothetical protein
LLYTNYTGLCFQILSLHNNTFSCLGTRLERAVTSPIKVSILFNQYRCFSNTTLLAPENKNTRSGQVTDLVALLTVKITFSKFCFHEYNACHFHECTSLVLKFKRQSFPVEWKIYEEPEEERFFLSQTSKFLWR